MERHVMEEPDNPKRVHTPETDKDDPAEETMSPKQGGRREKEEAKRSD